MGPFFTLSHGPRCPSRSSPIYRPIFIPDLSNRCFPSCIYPSLAFDRHNPIHPETISFPPATSHMQWLPQLAGSEGSNIPGQFHHFTKLPKPVPRHLKRYFLAGVTLSKKRSVVIPDLRSCPVLDLSSTSST